MILVTGATGTIGRRVVAELRQRGVPVRAMTRDPERAARGAGWVRGDFDDPSSLRTALDGADAVFLATVVGPSIGAHDAAMIDAAKRSGARKIVKLSALGTEQVPRLALGDWHHAGEEAVRSSGIAWTMLRPAAFASNALHWAPAIAARSAVPSSTGDGSQAVVDPRDVADVAVAALTSRAHDGRAYTLTGPELLTVDDQLAILGRALGRAVESVDVPVERMREGMLASGMPNLMVEAFVEGTRFVRDGHAAVRSGDVPTVLGRPPSSFAEWVRDHVAAFQ